MSEEEPLLDISALAPGTRASLEDLVAVITDPYDRWHEPTCEEVEGLTAITVVPVKFVAAQQPACTCKEDFPGPNGSLLDSLSSLETLAATTEVLMSSAEPSYEYSSLEAVLLAEPALAALGPQVRTAVAQRQAQAVSWRDSFGSDHLDLVATFNTLSSFSVRDIRPAVLGWGRRPLSSTELEDVVREDPSRTRQASALLNAHRARVRKPGRLLVTGTYGDVPFPGRSHVELALEVHRHGSVLILPRSLEPLVTGSSYVRTAVVRESDSPAVIETAATLANDGAGTPAMALKLARELA